MGAATLDATGTSTPSWRSCAAAALFSASIVARTRGRVLWCVIQQDLFAPALEQAGYGQSFAEGFAPHTKLSEVLAETDDRSLSRLHMDQLHHDHDHGHLERKISEAN